MNYGGMQQQQAPGAGQAQGAGGGPAGGVRPMSYADGSYNAHPVGANPERQREHARSKSLLSSFRTGSSSALKQQQQQQAMALTYNGRPSVSSLGAVPEDGMYSQQQQAQQQQQPTFHGQPQAASVQRQASLRQPVPMQASQLHPEIRSVVSLVAAHAHKVYFSGPLIERKERLTDGTRNTKDEAWTDVWAQLGGTTLSIWDMRAIDEASKLGKEVPPTYINIQDAFVQVVGSVTVPGADGQPPKRYTDVLTLNTAGSNLFLFSCPDTASLVSWASALRLAAWEKSRLEEIYTAHLLRMSLSDNNTWKDPKTTLVKGKLEGWAKVRVAGQVDWKRLWMVVTQGYSPAGGGADGRSTSPTPPAKKNRMSSLFNRSSSPTPSSGGHVENLRPTVSFFAGPKGKERKQLVISMSSVAQAFAVYPERPEMIPLSTLLKLEGMIGSEDYAMGMKGREGWLLIMPETENEKVGALEMLKWLVAIHDAFQLYGRPQGYTWDPREPQSMMFAYPVGPLRDHLFLDRELAEGLDPRDDRTSFIRSQLLGVQVRRMRGLPVQVGQQQQQHQSTLGAPTSPSGAPTLPPIGGVETPQHDHQQQKSTPQLPPLSFDQAKAKPMPPTPVSPVRANEVLGARPPSPAPAPTTTSAALQQQQQQQYQTTSPPMSPNSLSPPPAAGLPRPASPGTTSARAFQMAPRAPTPTGVRGTLGGPVVSSPTSSVGSYGGRPSIDGLPQPGGASQIATPGRLPQPPAMGAGPETVPPPAPMTPASQPLPSSLPTSPGQSQGHVYSPMPHHAESQERQNSYGQSYTSQQQQQQQQQQSPYGTPSPPHQPGYSSPPQQSQHSPYGQPSPQPPQQQQQSQAQGQQQPQADYFFDEASAALYYMQTHPQQPQQPQQEQQQRRQEEERSQHTSSVDSSRLAARTSLARKPSGARALPPPRRLAGAAPVAGAEKTRQEPLPPVQQSPGSPSPSPSRSRSPSPSPPPSVKQKHRPEPSSTTAAMQEDAADALAALSFLEAAEDERGQPTLKTSPQPSAVSVRPLAVQHKPLSPASPGPAPEYPSSFAKSRSAQEREAQQAARQAAAHRPGRPNGRNGNGNGSRNAWQSSDEEEEEEEDDDDDDGSGSDEPPRSAVLPPRMQMQEEQLSQQRERERERSPMPPDVRSRQMQDSYSQQMQQQRAPRVLPQIPGGRSPSASHQGHQTPPRGYDDASPSRYHDEQERRPSPHPRGQSSSQPMMPPSRQTVWSTVLDPSAPQPQVNAPHGRETFVQLEPSETMTKAFTPQGLLQAGLQDKSDRSAKKQEELARETGASLINVPSKPPPPQTGLLGAITAHERDRKREGGVGAVLTEREREKRLAEERQRKIDDLSRQQLEQLGSGASMYNMPLAGGQPQFNPMMYMNPMMSMYGFPGMMPPPMASPMGSPMGAGGMPAMNAYQAQQQQMWAAQAAAAEAYQRTMMSFSQAGSVAGDAQENSSPVAAQQPQQAQQQPQWNPQMMQMNPMMSMYGFPGMMPPPMMSAPPSEFGGGGMMGMGMGMGHLSQQGSPGQSPMGARRNLGGDADSPARGNSPARQ